MSYLETVTSKRQEAQAAQQSQASRDSVLRQLKSIEQATTAAGDKQPEVLTVRQQRLFDSLRDLLETDEQKALADNHREVVEVLKDLKQAIDASQSATDSQTQEIQQRLQQMVSAVKALDMSPVVNLPAPQVQITEKDIDFGPLQATIRAAMAQKPEIILPEQEAPETDWTDLSRYRAQDLQDGEERQYIGFVNPEGNWYIIENDVKQNRMRYVFGTTGYAKHFQAASTYKYLILDKAINAAA
jgi:hypothetical protein